MSLTHKKYAPSCPTHRTLNTGFCSMATNFDHEAPSSPPHSTSGSSARSMCAARGRLSLRTRRPILDLRSILPLIVFVFCSHSSLADALRALTGGLAAGLDAGAAPKTFPYVGPPPPVAPGDPRARPCPFRPLTAPSARASVARLQREYLRRIAVGVPIGGVHLSIVIVYMFSITFTCPARLLATVVRRSEAFRRIP